MDNKDKNKKIDPKLPGGFKDYNQSETLIREKMIDVISKKFEEFGFMPIKTSSVERYDVLTGGEKNINKQIFKLFREDESEDTNLALRFDLTVPLSRFVADNMSEIKFPFKRYEIGNVWRGERQQAGRFKEFIQCDVDTVGSRKEESDAEMIALIWSVLKALNVGKFKIKINSREILNALPEYAEFEPSKLENVIRALDKLSKIGWGGVSKELSESPIDFGASKIDLVKDFVETRGEDSLKTIKLIENKVGGINSAVDGSKNLFKIVELAKELGVPEDALEVDFSLARGLSYYTGMVLETFLEGRESFGSVASGGRYDGLIERFVSVKIPAVGVSIGFDRLFDAIKDDNLNFDSGSKVMFLNFDESVLPDLTKLVSECRKGGVPVEIYIGNDESMQGQISYALNIGTRFVCIFGSKEKDNNVVIVKNLESREQEEVKIGEVVDYLKKQIS